MELNDKILQNIEDILREFDIEHVKYGNRISFTCPVHGSDNNESATIYTNSSYVSTWYCWTNHCEEKCGKDMIGFMSGLLKTDRSGVIRWCHNRFGGHYEIKSNPEKRDNQSFVTTTNILTKQRNTESFGVPRYDVRKSLSIPAQYFIGRGFTKEVLDKYDVGFCENRARSMYNRVIVPIYNDDHKYMVGCMGRTVYPKCIVCNMFHNISSPCPTNKDEKRNCSKWKHSGGFNAGSYFYNYWYAKPIIESGGIAILVEGQGDIWRLEEAGIHCGLGMFGTFLTDERKILLTESGAQSVIIATDSDDAGKEARKKLEEYLPRFYNVYSVDIKSKDVGDMSTDDVKKLFMPILERC